MTEKVNIYVQNLDLTERIEDYIEKKSSKFEKVLKGIDDIRFDLAHVKSARNANDRHVSQITIRGKGFILRAEERSDDIFTAIDESMDKINRQIERFKGKKYRNRSAGGTRLSEVAPLQIDIPEKEDEEEFEPVIVRRKTFSMNPMDEIEAIEQMKLLGHDNFFIFFNVDTNGINVLYRRRDGNYGLIEPKLG